LKEGHEKEEPSSQTMVFGGSGSAQQYPEQVLEASQQPLAALKL